jgi:hypothetical protein
MIEIITILAIAVFVGFIFSRISRKSVEANIVEKNPPAPPADLPGPAEPGAKEK